MRLLYEESEADQDWIKALTKASFGGDRSAAGRYAAEQRWKGHQKKEPSGAQGRSPSSDTRTTNQKLKDGPTNLLYGRDDKGMPVMGTVAELTKRFGSTADARSAYFRDKYNLKVEVEKQEEGTTKEFAESAQLGALQALEELCLSLNNVGSLVRKVSVVPSEETRGSGMSNGSFIKDSAGAVVNLSTSPCAWTAESLVGTVAIIQGFKAERGQRPSLEEAMLQATVPSMFGAVEAALTDLKPFFGKSEPANQQDSTALIHRASQRMGYSVMVHEFGHAVDAAKTNFFTSAGLSADPSWLELESPSGYGRTNNYEKTAESFAAWWLFSSGSQGKASNAFTRTRDLGVKVVAPIFSQKEDVVKSEKISLVFAELPKDNPVFVFVLAGFFNDGVVKARPENPWKRGYNTEYFRVRDAVLARKPLCYKCKKNRASEVDHVRPLINGGSNTVGNLRPVCVSCNRKSGGGERRVRKSVRVDAMVDLAFDKASFGGDRSAAGRYAAEQRWKGHVKAEVKVPTTARARDITEELKTYFGTDTETYAKSQGYEDVQQRLIDQQKQITGQGDLRLELIAKKQGFDGLPKVVSSEEMSRLEKDGWTIAYRGIEDSEEGSGEDFAEQFRTGDYFAGLGVYGNGIYFASEKAVAKVYSGGSGGGGAIIKIAIPPNVILTESDFKERLAKHRDTMMGSSAVDQWGTKQGEFYGGDDLGRALAAQGVRGASLTGFVMSKTSEVIIIWDRSMLAVEESQKTK